MDPRTHAVRGDIADVRLAARVFAPHYADPVERRLVRAASLREAAATDSAEIALLAPGDVFELLELAGDHGWGIAPRHGLVGYVPANALGKP